jgi:hypothetical protein
VKIGRFLSTETQTLSTLDGGADSALVRDSRDRDDGNEAAINVRSTS